MQTIILSIEDFNKALGIDKDRRVVAINLSLYESVKITTIDGNISIIDKDAKINLHNNNPALEEAEFEIKEILSKLGDGPDPHTICECIKFWCKSRDGAGECPKKRK